MPEKEFKFNEYIKLKMENENINIYIDGELFNQCKYLTFQINLKNVEIYDEIGSIDDNLMGMNLKIEEIVKKLVYLR